MTMQHTPSLLDAIQNWPGLGLDQTPTLIKLFKQGKNHQCGLIEAGNKRYVAKLFRHSFSRTMSAEQLSSKAQISPRIVGSADNIALYEYIEDKGFSDQARRQERIEKISITLKKAHVIKITEFQATNIQTLDIIASCGGYLKDASDELLSWHAQLMPILQEFSCDTTPKVFCHNDLVLENCLFDDTQAWLIDWEYAQINNPWFDLASVLLYFELEQDEANLLLRNYFGANFDTNKTSAACRISQISQLTVLWCDLLWHTYIQGSDYLKQHSNRVNDLKNRAQKLGVQLVSC